MSSPLRHRRYFFVRTKGLALFVLELAAMACQEAKPPSQSKTLGQEQPMSVLATQVKKASLPLLREAVGHAAPFYGVTVRPQVDGRLDKICFQEGDFVRAGQTLGVIDPRPLHIAIATATAALTRDKATLKNAQLNLTRYQSLRHDKMVSEQQLTDQQALVSTSEAVVLSDEAQLAQAKLQLDYAHVKAPIDGITGFRGIDPGTIVRAADSNGLVTINQINPMAVLFSLPQDDLPEVFSARDANTAIVRVFARDANTSLGEGPLVLVDNQVQSQTGTIRLKAIVANPNHMLWPSQFLRVSLQLRRLPEAFVVPAVSIRSDQEASVIYVVQKGHARRVPVRIVGQANEDVAVEGDLKEAQQVVTEGAARLKDGAAIFVKASSSTTESAAP